MKSNEDMILALAGQFKQLHFFHNNNNNNANSDDHDDNNMK